MRQLHVNNKNEIKPCQAKPGRCAFQSQYMGDLSKGTTSSSVTRLSHGYTHEYLVAQAIINNSSCAQWGQDGTQQQLQQARMTHLNNLSQESPHRVDSLTSKAYTTSTLLPSAHGDVQFTEASVNPGEVYDVLYYDVHNNPIRVSCKTSTVEDKSYRFSTQQYGFREVNEYLRTLFTPEDQQQGTSYRDVLRRNNVTVHDLQQHIVTMLGQSLRSPRQNQTRDMMKRLTNDQFVGRGDYYKTLRDGSVVYYPKNDRSTHFTIHPDSVHMRNPAVEYTATMLNTREEVMRQYHITFRVKFKDGVDKPVQLSQQGTPTNLGATVTVDLV